MGLRAVFTWLSKGIGFGFGFGFTTPFGWLVYLLWFWFYDSQVKTVLIAQLVEHCNTEAMQGAKKIIFTACHSGKLKLAFTSPDIISTSPNQLISQFFCNSNSSKNITCLSGKVRTEFTTTIAKSTSPGLLDTTFFARCHGFECCWNPEICLSV